jgi:Ser/Thr protein kinase RdoA (MazF antagonist)
MPDFVQVHSQRWVDHFAGQGHDVRQLAAGVEGAVYDLGDGRVAKVWRDRRVAELECMQRFYADVVAAGLHLSTPEILAIERVDGLSVTYERKLPGQPLQQQQLTLEDHTIDPPAARCVIEVLQALATIPATAAMRHLAVLDEDQPLWAGAATFRAALMNLLRRRAARFGPVIRDSLPDFNLRYAALIDRLETLTACPDTVIHGDLVPANILVDAGRRVTFSPSRGGGRSFGRALPRDP